jgi:hypothetical protein
MRGGEEEAKKGSSKLDLALLLIAAVLLTITVPLLCHYCAIIVSVLPRALPHHALPCDRWYRRVEHSRVSSRVANMNSATLCVAARIAL